MLKVITQTNHTIRNPLGVLINAELNIRFNHPIAGLFWLFLEPIVFLLCLSACLMVLNVRPPLGESTILFYATGFLPLHVWLSLVHVVGRSRILFENRPKFRPIQIEWFLISRSALNGPLSMFAILIQFMLIVMCVTDANASMLFDITIWLCVLTLSGIGFGVFHCAMMQRIVFWEVMWSIAARLMVVISGVFFLIDGLPERLAQVLSWNPLVHIIQGFRQAVFPYYQPQSSMIYVLLFSLSALAFGSAVLAATDREECRHKAKTRV